MAQSRNVFVLILASAFTMVGATIIQPMAFMYFMEEGFSLSEIAIISAVSSVGFILFTFWLRPFLGDISDIYGRKKIIVSFSFVVSLLTPLYAVIRNTTGFALFDATRNVAFESPAPVRNAALADAAPRKRRATTFGAYSAVQTIAYTLALLGGGAIVVWGLEIEWLFCIASICFLASSVVLALFLKETVEIERVQPQKSRFQRFFGGVRTMVTQRSSLGLMLYTIFLTAALSTPLSIPLFAVRELGADISLVGPIRVVPWITSAVFSPIGGLLSDWLGKRKILIVLGLTLVIIFNVAAVFSPSLLWVVVFLGVVGAANGISLPVMAALMVDIVPPKRRGTYFGTLSSVGGIGGVAALMYGVVEELFGIKWTSLIASAFYALAVFTVVAFIKEGKVIGEEEFAS